MSFPSSSGGVRIKDHVSSPSSLGKWAGEFEAVAVDPLLMHLGDKYATGDSVTPCIVIATKASGDDRDDWRKMLFKCHKQAINQLQQEQK